MIRQPFHLVEYSPWPLTGSVGAFSLTVGLVSWFHGSNLSCAIFGLVLILITMIQWWRDIIREATFIGFHTSFVAQGMRWGIILFILSEVCFFFAFFWAFFHRRLAPTPEIGCSWPPAGILPLDPFAIPLLNTAVLLASGVTVTWAHHALIAGSRKETAQALALTVILGAYFTLLQAEEYINAPFTLADSVYGRCFFVATGFHGLHVIIGTTFLIVCLFRVINYHFSSGHHFGFEAAAWYWHFVDVVWVFLYLCIYWWGSLSFTLQLTTKMAPISFFRVFILFFSTIMAFSACNWRTLWIALELNIMAFIPLILFSSQERSSERAIKYFIAQTIGSIFILLGGTSTLPLFIILGALIKAGIAPFHFWMPVVFRNISWVICSLIATWQKIIPVLLTLSFSSFNFKFAVIAAGAWFGSIGALKASNLKELLAFSSISHISWVVASASISASSVYFTIYLASLLPLLFRFSFFAPTSFYWSSSGLALPAFLSIRGLPPFLGFYPKLIVLANTSFFISVPLIISSMVMLFVYLSAAFYFFFSHDHNQKKIFFSSLIFYFSLSFLFI